MTTSNPRNTFASRSTLIFSGLLAVTHGALAAQPVFDAQLQARQIILGQSTHASALDVYSGPAAAVFARELRRADPQAQIRRFILAEATARSTADSEPQGMASASVRGAGRADPQQQAREFIVARPALRGIASRAVLPVSNTGATLAVSASATHGIDSESA
jgi:hypothetical protein